MSRTLALFALLLSLLASPAWGEDRRYGGKLLLTDGVSSVEGSAGGGLATWAVIAGRETEDGNGGTAHLTYVALPDFDLISGGAAFGFSNRVELSYAYQRFDTRAAGAVLGLGHGFTFGQHIIGAKVRLLGDAVWDQNTIVPQVAAGIQYKIAEQGPILRAIGAVETKDADFYVAATKVWLAQSMVLNATLRLTKGNQFGLLGFGNDGNARRGAQFEGSIGRLVTRKLLIGSEYRSKPDNLQFAHENDSFDIFAAWAVHRNLAITAAYVDLGNIATMRDQHGLLLSLQGAF